MARMIRRGRPAVACLALVVFHGPAGAAEGPATRTAQATSPHDMQSHSMPSAGERPELPPALPGPVAPPADPAQHAPAVSLGLADLEQIALRRNPTLAQAAAGIAAARARSLQAGLQNNPVVGYNAEQLNAGTARLGEQQGLFIDQEFIRREKLDLSRAKYAQEAEAARWQAIAQQYRVLNGVRLNYLDVLAVLRRIEIEGALLKNAEVAVQTTEELVNVGQANEPDLLQARVEARRARIALRTEENRYRADWESLVSLVGAPELRPSPLAGSLEADSPLLEFDTTLAHLLQASPELQAVLAEVRRDEITVRREQAEPRPNLLFRTSVGYNFETNNPSASVQLGLRLPIYDKNQGTIREAMADLCRTRAEVDRVALSLRRRLADAFARYQTASQSVAEFRSQILPDARRATAVMRRNFGQRRAAYPQVLVAERAVLQQEADYVAALHDLRQAEVEIRGLLLTDGLTGPDGPTSQGHIEANPRPR